MVVSDQIPAKTIREAKDPIMVLKTRATKEIKIRMAIREVLETIRPIAIISPITDSEIIRQEIRILQEIRIRIVAASGIIPKITANRKTAILIKAEDLDKTIINKRTNS